MAKGKKKQKQKRGGALMGRSDIPYAQRLAMQHHDNIVVNRNHSAKVALYCLSVAIHEVKGVGYKNLVKFGLAYKEVEDEIYEDLEYGMAKAKRRMEQMGMPISGELYSIPVPGLTKRQQQVHDHALQAAQISLIAGAITMNEVFGYGKIVQDRISERSYELSERYNKEGEGFLLEAMEKIGFTIVDGNVMAYVDEDMKAVHPRKAEVMK